MSAYAVLLMHVACQPESESLYEKIANTWPPLEAAKGLPINWDAAQIDQVKGTSLPDAVKQLQADASEAFEKVVQPMIGRNASLAPSATPNGHSLKEGFYQQHRFGALPLSRRQSHAPLPRIKVGSAHWLICSMECPRAIPRSTLRCCNKWPFYMTGVTATIVIWCTAGCFDARCGGGRGVDLFLWRRVDDEFASKFGAVPLQVTWVNPNEEAEIVITAEAVLPNEFNKGKDGEGGLQKITKSSREGLASMFEIGDSLLLTEAELSAGEKGDGDEEEDEEEEGGALSAFADALRTFISRLSRLPEGGVKGGCTRDERLSSRTPRRLFMEEKLLEMTTEDIRPDKKILSAQLIHVMNMVCSACRMLQLRRMSQGQGWWRREPS